MLNLQEITKSICIRISKPSPLTRAHIQLLQDLSQLPLSVKVSLLRCAGSLTWGLATKLLN